jgi:hypothetical protein
MKKENARVVMHVLGFSGGILGGACAGLGNLQIVDKLLFVVFVASYLSWEGPESVSLQDHISQSYQSAVSALYSLRRAGCVRGVYRDLGVR